MPLRGARSLSRRVFDLALVEAAVVAGARFLPECHARVGMTGPACAEVLLADSETGQNPVRISTKLVLVADGIGGTALQTHPEFSAAVRSTSRIGTGAISLRAAEFYGRGSIFMACGESGYIGLVRLEDSLLALTVPPATLFMAISTRCCLSIIFSKPTSCDREKLEQYALHQARPLQQGVGTLRQ